MLEILDQGFFITVQDGGRSGLRRAGVPLSGAMDRFALAAANHLVGNLPGAACLEFAMTGGGFVPDDDLLIAAAGPGWSLEIEGRALPGWMSVKVNAGDRIALVTSGMGRWGYLAVHGGLDVPVLMGSRSTCPRAGFGGWQGRTLRAGDRLPVKETPSVVMDELAGQSLNENFLPDYWDEITIGVIPGPHTDRFTEDKLKEFFNTRFVISEESDRMGYRLEGPGIMRKGAAEILSLGVVPGAIQVPAGGSPVVLMCDAQTTGGYALIGTVIRADLPRLAQLMPGGRMRFKETTAGEAAVLLEDQLGRLAAGLANTGC